MGNISMRSHFQKNLLDRYQLQLSAEQIDDLEKQIRFGLLKQITSRTLDGTAVFKYIHEYGTDKQKRIYVVAQIKSGEVISVEKPNWSHNKANKHSSQRPRGSKGRAKRKVF